MPPTDPCTNATCPRCAAPFACGAPGPTPCPCGEVRLDQAALAALRERFAGCLCLACLGEVAGGACLERVQRADAAAVRRDGGVDGGPAAPGGSG